MIIDINILKVIEESRKIDTLISVYEEYDSKTYRKIAEIAIPLCNALSYRLLKAYGLEKEVNSEDSLSFIANYNSEETFCFMPENVRSIYIPTIVTYKDPVPNVLLTEYYPAICNFLYWVLRTYEFIFHDSKIVNEYNQRLYELELILGIEKHAQPKQLKPRTDLELLERVKRIEDKIDNITDIVTCINSDIKQMQNEVSIKLDNAITDNEYKDILDQFLNEYFQKMVEQIKANENDQEYEYEQRILILALGQNAWEKLQPQSKKFLVSARVIFRKFLNNKEIVDYSGVCILVTKVLETELKRRFYYDYIEYLDNTLGRKNIHKYPKALVFKGRSLLFEDKFTLGSIPVLFKSSNENEKVKEYEQNTLCVYLEKKIFIPEIAKDDRIPTIHKYASEIEEICKKYRNPAAHTNEIKKQNAQECFDYIIDVQKFLKVLLDSFIY